MAKKEIKKKLPRFSINFSKKYLLFIFVFIIISGAVYFGYKFLFVASVNGKLISRYSVIKELEKQGGKKTLDTIILKKLIYQEAKKRNLSLTEKELKDELSKIEKSITSQGATLETILQQQGMTMKELEEQVNLQLLVTKMVDSKVSVTDEEIDEYLSYATDLTRDEAKEAVTQQKQQEKIGAFLDDLKSKAKINYFIQY